MSSEIYLYLAIIGIVSLLISFSQWKFSVYFFFIWLVLEGVFRKWITPGIEKPIFFVKFFILIGPFFKSFLSQRSFRMPSFMPLLYIYFLWGLIECANFSATTDSRVFVIGLIIHFSFVTLIFIIPLIFNSKEKMIFFFRAVVVISLPVFLLGILQYSLPQTHFLNKYVEESSNVVSVRGATRITGTFSYMASYSSFVKFAFMISLLLIIIEKKAIFVITCIFVINLALLNSLFTGSRGLIVINVTALLFFLFCSIFIKDKAITIFWKRFVIIFFVAILAITTSYGQESLDNIVYRFAKNSGEETKSRILDTFALPELQNAGIMGYGIGTTYQGNRQFVNLHIFGLAYESEKSRFILELGLGGYVLIMFLRAWIVFWAWRIFFSVSSPSKIFVVFFLFNLHLGLALGATFSYMENIIYWFGVGMLIAVDNLDKKVRFSRSMIINNSKLNH